MSIERPQSLQPERVGGELELEVHLPSENFLTAARATRMAPNEDRARDEWHRGSAKRQREELIALARVLSDCTGRGREGVRAFMLP